MKNATPDEFGYASTTVNGDPDRSVRSFVASQKSLLDLELRSEQDEEDEAAAAGASSSSAAASAAGNAGNAPDYEEERPQNVLRNLEVEVVSVGLYGRTVVSFSARTGRTLRGGAAGGVAGDGHCGTTPGTVANVAASSPGVPLLPAHRLTVGDEVEVLSKSRGRGHPSSTGGGDGGSSSSRDRRSPGGVICALTETEISVALFGPGGRRRADGDSSNNQNTGAAGRGVGGSGPGRKKGKKGGRGGSAGGKSYGVDDDVDDDDQDGLYGLGPPPLSIVPRSSAEVHRKMVSALDELGRYGTDHPVAGSVVRALFCPEGGGELKRRQTTAVGAEEAEAGVRTNTTPQHCYNPNLDRSQVDAVDFCLPPSSSASSSSYGTINDRPVSLIHGPPGTGKTTTVVELIRRAVHDLGWRVLVTAPSNVAVDNVLEKLVSEEDQQQKQSQQRTAGKVGGGGRRQQLQEGRGSSNNRGRKLRAVRLGHPARIRPSIMRHSLESLVQNADGTEIVCDVRAELTSYLKVLSADPEGPGRSKKGGGGGKSSASDRRAARREIKLLRAELRRREEAVVRELIGNADVVLATNVGAASSILDRYLSSPSDRGSGGGSGNKVGGFFDLVVIDEAAQALEASCWIPALRGRRLVLAGDHRQLPPTIKSRDGAVQRGLGRTMFERAVELYGDDVGGGSGAGDEGGSGGRVSRMLRVQYRMHEDIADWASAATYGGGLVSHDTVRLHRLADLPGVRGKEWAVNAMAGEIGDDYDDNNESAPITVTATVSAASAPPLLLIDTAGCDMHESTSTAGSRYNEGEARIVKSHVTSLLSAGVKPEQIAVISPYNGQVELLRSILLPTVSPDLECRTVDGFQGGEREAVVLSLVRSSDGRGGGGTMGTIGFLRDERRLNVAVTRARRHCCVICDTETVTRSDFIKDLVAWMEERGDYRTAMEFEERNEVDGFAFDSSVLVQASQGENDAKSLEVVPSPAMKRGESKKLITSQPRSATDSEVNTSNKRGGEPRTTARKPTPEGAKAERRRQLMDKISSFADNGKRGDEMILSASLSKFDRLIVHELAEQLGLGHRSEGTEGMNRRIIVTALNVGTEATQTEAVAGGGEHPTDSFAPVSAFAALDVESSSDSEGSDNDTPAAERGAPVSTANTLLGSLAKERMERHQQQQQQQQRRRQQQIAKPALKGSKKSKKKKKSSGKKSGGNAQTRPSESAEETMGADDVDDMAFLDAQIEKVQTSHGRKVAGSGKAYKSIINGVLLAKPTPPEPKKDARASAALKAKLKNAEDGRRSKGGKKKKK